MWEQLRTHEEACIQGGTEAHMWCHEWQCAKHRAGRGMGHSDAVEAHKEVGAQYEGCSEAQAGRQAGGIGWGGSEQEWSGEDGQQAELLSASFWHPFRTL